MLVFGCGESLNGLSNPERLQRLALTMWAEALTCSPREQFVEGEVA
jgi:hypothetical protein